MTPMVKVEALMPAIQAGDWKEVASRGRALMEVSHGYELAVTARYVALAMEHLGQWLSLADVAGPGVSVCESIGLRDEHYAALLKSAGRGYYDRQQYNASHAAFEKLLSWANATNNSQDIAVAKFGIACCYEKTNGYCWQTAFALYSEVFNCSTNWGYKIVSIVNQIELLLRHSEIDLAYDHATTQFLQVPAHARTSVTWVELLRLLALMEVRRGRPDVAMPVLEDALDMVPSERHSVLARTHAVRALAEHSLGNGTEAKEAIELAWMYAEVTPDAETCRLLREVETNIEGG